MAAINHFKAYTTKLEKGLDEKGNFQKYRYNYEQPCDCHPETCCHFDEKVWVTKEYKLYEDGSKIFL